MSYKPWYEVSKGYEGCDLVPLNSGNSFKVGDVIDGDIVYHMDDDFLYVIAPSSKRFKAKWEEAKQVCEKKGYELPTIGDLFKLYALKDFLDRVDESGGQNTFKRLASDCSYVWSATESGQKNAYEMDFDNGDEYANLKDCFSSVAPVKKIVRGFKK